MYGYSHTHIIKENLTGMSLKRLRDTLDKCQLKVFCLFCQTLYQHQRYCFKSDLTTNAMALLSN